MISIVIPLYNKTGLVCRTLESVRQQLFAGYEVIIVDDGSTDGSIAEVEAYLSANTGFAAKVRMLYQRHSGVSAARNRGISESLFDWIAFLDADDTWMPDYLQEQCALSAKYPGCDVLGTGYTYYRGQGQLESSRINKLPFKGEDGALDNYFVIAASSDPPLCSSFTMVRKRAILQVGGFPDGISSGEDLLTWARLALRFDIAYNRRSLGLYNQDPSTLNQDQRDRMPENRDAVGAALEDLLRSHGNMPGLRNYVGAWHKMRARIYLSNSMRKEAWDEWRKLVRFNPVHYKTWAYLLLLISPVKAFQ